MDLLKFTQSAEDEQVAIVPNQRHNDSEQSDVSFTGLLVYTIYYNKYLRQTSTSREILAGDDVRVL
uniref:Uncharacterized protein n=1 Tax=Heterorhabditis bacteriophora TaxID=37862 RepID=A0A1I7WWI6_HETBA